MKRNLLIIAAFSMIFASVDAKSKKPVVAPAPPAPVFANGVDSMSYALGLNVGADFGKNITKIPGGKSNIDLIIKGFATAMKGDSALMTAAFANEFFRSYITKAQAVETDAKREAGVKFLTENKTKPGVITTESGLQYEIIKAAEGPKPKETDSVKVHYQGFLLDGTKFDSSVDRGEPITFPLNGVIKGWTEGVQLMSVGAKYKFYVPYTLGYGEQGTPNGGPIPGFATLIFEVELLGISPVVEPVAPKAVVAAPKTTKKATTTKSTKKSK
ncbi:MAG: FKBP-type peptidyl-prolyl cis-trans isomerase [Bacteroidales bacterium]|nr:FKBP-type peptidyl-prolyl cis-trans isomerase [Bacteroidales bacterium]